MIKKCAKKYPGIVIKSNQSMQEAMRKLIYQRMKEGKSMVIWRNGKYQRIY